MQPTDQRTVDTLIVHADIATFDATHRFVTDGAIAIDGGAIVDIGPTADVQARSNAATTIDAATMIAVPGLTDAHVHTAQSLMRGLVTDIGRRKALRVPTWREYYLPFEAALTPDDLYLSGQLCYSTMLLLGTTTFFESGGPHPAEMARAADELGIRGTVAWTTMDQGARIPDALLDTTDVALAKNVDLVDALAGRADSIVSASMALRQLTTCTPELIRDIHVEASRRGVKVHTHLLEGTYEIDFTLERYGKRPVAFLEDLGVFDSTLHGAHSILADDDEISAYARSGVSAAHCAKGNYGIGRAPAVRMHRRGVDIGLGTDGVANLGSLDLFRVAMLTRIGQQLIEGTPSHNRNFVGATEPLEMAATGGARAMGWGDEIGSLEVGKRADIVMLRTDQPDAAGYDSSEAFLYECASGRDVHTVIVDGRTVVEDATLLTADADDISRRAAARQRELATALTF